MNYKQTDILESDDEIIKMPDKFKGSVRKGNQYINSNPRKWTDEEVEWCLNLSEQGYTYKDIAESVGRTVTSVSIKMKRLSKKNGDYNSPHIKDKYKTNDDYIKKINPKSLLDVYAGDCFYSDYDFKYVTNDIDKNKPTDYNLDALKFLCKMYYEDKKFDIVDLDPFGSAYDCFDLSIKMANKGIIITLGEMGHKRFKRLDYVKRYYGIESIDMFTSDVLIEHIQKIGIKNKKQLDVVFKKDWNMISRVYFEINPMKITEQWEKEGDAEI